MAVDIDCFTAFSASIRLKPNASSAEIASCSGPATSTDPVVPGVCAPAEPILSRNSKTNRSAVYLPIPGVLDNIAVS